MKSESASGSENYLVKDKVKWNWGTELENEITLQAEVGTRRANAMGIVLHDANGNVIQCG